MSAADSHDETKSPARAGLLADDGSAASGRIADAAGAADRAPAPIDLDALFAAPERPRLRVSFGGTIVIALVVAAIAVLVIALQPRSADGVPLLAETDAMSTSAEGDFTRALEAKVLVHVLGQVQHPGVYELAADARVVDAVTAAGGFTAEADIAAMNLARKLVDGEQIYVTAVGETRAPVDGAAAPSGAGGSGGTLVNLNTATATELETLPRIGPAMAQRILDYRAANGPFQSVDELTEVPGIGDATLEGLRDLVTV